MSEVRFIFLIYFFFLLFLSMKQSSAIFPFPPISHTFKNSWNVRSKFFDILQTFFTLLWNFEMFFHASSTECKISRKEMRLFEKSWCQKIVKCFRLKAWKLFSFISVCYVLIKYFVLLTFLISFISSPHVIDFLCFVKEFPTWRLKWQEIRLSFEDFLWRNFMMKSLNLI